MIHAYHDFYLPIVQELLANMFEIGVYYENKSLEDMVDILLIWDKINLVESGDPVIVCGKSANEWLGIILDKPPFRGVQPVYASSEYWFGYVLAYAGWYFNIPYKTIIEKYGLDRLKLNYFPFHEMDIMHLMDDMKKKMELPNKLKYYRELRGYSQTELAMFADVSIRSIKAYEQETNELSKANGETLYKLAKVLRCSIEDLILY